MLSSNISHSQIAIPAIADQMWKPGPEIFSVSEHNALDRLAEENGLSVDWLMENAGRQVANAIALRWPTCSVNVLCGPGNNGGDGYVTARHLEARGYQVRVIAVGDHHKLKGAAALKRDQWKGATIPFDHSNLPHAELCVDAVFGAGLSRPLQENLASALGQIETSDIPIVAIDVPSGIGGDEGKFLDQRQEWSARLTITFARKKPAHVLYPSRRHCGEIVCADIGVPSGLIEATRALNTSTAHCRENNWRPFQDFFLPEDHKYFRGFCLIASGPVHSTGAARLAARAALRAGAGLVTIVSDPHAATVHRPAVDAVMVRQITSEDEYRALVEDSRVRSLVVGPGLGLTPDRREMVLAPARIGKPSVFDADALTLFKDQPDDLFKYLNAGSVLTPHTGEFERLFPDLLTKSINRIEAAVLAAKRSNAIIVLKGADTVVANPDGEAVVNTNAPRSLATAGSGDVLAGIIAGLLAQGIQAFRAASAGVYLHGQCGQLAGEGAIAEDLVEWIPEALKTSG